ncbi:MAG: pyridoxamine 5'-phosphate oxidase family protein [Beijerinckiaceae bacterium]
MRDWAKTGLAASLSGSIASIVTTGALAALARAEGTGALQPTNSTSHWLRGERAGRVKRMDAAHTLTGYATHHASAILWALPFEIWLKGRRPRTPSQLLLEAAGVSAVAAAVDYGLAPKRFTPGWENVLPVRSIIATYGVLALGLAAGALATQSLRSGMNAAAASNGADPYVRRGNGGARPHPHDHRQHEGAAKLYKLIEEMRICMMTTRDEQGRLVSRPMYALAPDETGDLWFFTKISSPKVSEFARDGHVNLAFSDPGKQNYVSVSGRAQIVRDPAVVERKWREPMRAWFPEGRDDPELTLVRVHPETGEYWDSPSGAVMYLYGYAKAALTGEPPKEMADTAKVDLS